MNAPAGSPSAVSRMGIESGFLILESGYDSDCDETLRTELVQLCGAPLIDSETDEVVDAVVIWWRDHDGDLVDSLVDALTYLVDGGAIWLLTPKLGRAGHVEPSDIQDAAPTAGLSQTVSFSVGADWTATRLVARKGAKK